MNASWINPWLALVIAGVLEVVWASGFKYVGTQRPLISLGVGAAMAGMRPVVEIMYEDFLTISMEQLVNQAANHRTMSGRIN